MIFPWPLIGAQQDTQIAYDQFAGLQVKVNGVPFLKGSAFQYFDAKSGASLYSSRWSPKKVLTLSDGTIRVVYNGANGNALGTIDHTRTIEGWTARYQFRWRGTSKIRVENTLGLIWAPFVSHGEAKADQQPLYGVVTPLFGDWAERKLAGPAKVVSFEANLATIKVDSITYPVKLVDARGYAQDWAKSSCLLWLGQSDIFVDPGDTTEVVVKWTVDPKAVAIGTSHVARLTPYELKGAVQPRTEPLPLVPKPAKATFGAGTCNLFRPGQSPPNSWRDELSQLIAKHWRTAASAINVPMKVDFEPGRTKPEGYVLRVSPEGIHMTVADDFGAKTAIETLAKLVIAKDRTLQIPCMTAEDAPVLKWRGVHQFNSKPSGFSVNMAGFLSSLGFNHLVVQCERTQWDALPAEKRSWSTKDELKTQFELARANRLEPIPLIQSLGHMDWLLDSDLRTNAINKDVPYTLDPRKESSRSLMQRIWREAIDLLHPRTLHFGLDEIDMRGMPDDPTIATRIWKVQTPNLARIAQNSKASIAVWGDAMLQKGDAPDACHAPNAEQAAERRSYLPPQSNVFDWHYLETDDPAKFTSLEKWKAWGMRPVASSWYKPRNIRAHTLAAIKSGVGALQTTWAGYETNEQSVIANPEQYTAYVLAADYAWSGRVELPSKLGYNALEILRASLWPNLDPVQSTSGTCWLPEGHPMSLLKIGNVSFQTMPLLSLNTPLTGPGSLAPNRVEVSLKKRMVEIDLAADCVGWEAEGELLAEMKVTYANGQSQTFPIRYGADVRAPEDSRPSVVRVQAQGFSLLRFQLNESSVVDSISFAIVSRTGGLRIRGLTTW